MSARGVRPLAPLAVVLVLVALTAASSPSPPASGQSAPSVVRINPFSPTVAEGKTVEVSLDVVAPVQGLTGWDITVAYDQSVVIATDCKGEAGSRCQLVPPNSFRVVKAPPSPTPVPSGSGSSSQADRPLEGVKSVAKVKFYGRRIGFTSLTLGAGSFTGAAAIVGEPVVGSILVVTTASPSPSPTAQSTPRSTPRPTPSPTPTATPTARPTPPPPPPPPSAGARALPTPTPTPIDRTRPRPTTAWLDLNPDRSRCVPEFGAPVCDQRRQKLWSGDPKTWADEQFRQGMPEPGPNEVFQLTYEFRLAAGDPAALATMARGMGWAQVFITRTRFRNPFPGESDTYYNYVEVLNVGGAAQDLTDWELRSSTTSDVFVFAPGFILEPGVECRVRRPNDRPEDCPGEWRPGRTLDDRAGHTPDRGDLELWVAPLDLLAERRSYSGDSREQPPPPNLVLITQ
jgi:hypothetical protein